MCWEKLMSVDADYKVLSVIYVAGGAVVVAQCIRSRNICTFDVSYRTLDGQAFLTGLGSGSRIRSVLFREGESGYDD